VPGENGTTKCNLCGVHVGGFPYQRVTTFIDVLEDTFNLRRYDKRMIARGLALRGDLVLKAQAGIGSDDEIDQVCTAAAEAAGASAKATTGTAIHSFTDQIESGQPRPIMTPDAERDVDAYLWAVSSRGLVPAEIEVPIVIDGVRPTPTARGVSGRFDRIYQMPEPCPTCGSLTRVADLKTGRIDYGESKMSMQLAAYASGKRYDPATGERTELGVCQCVGWIIHLPVGSGKASFHAVNLEAGRNGLSVALSVWQWRSRDGMMLEDEAPQVQPRTEADIYNLIKISAGRDDIAQLYEHFTASGEWTAHHTAYAEAHLAGLEGAPAS
jgi:hypothetical protein